MTDDVGVIVVQYEDGVLDSCGGPTVFTNIVRQDFVRLSIKLPDTVSITRDDEKSNVLIIKGVEDDKLRAKIASFTTGTLASLKARGCRIVRISVSAKSATRQKTTRPLPVANHKASGFAAYRGNVGKGSRSSGSGSTLTTGTSNSKDLSSSQPMSLTRSPTRSPTIELPPRPQSLPKPSRSLTRLDSDNDVQSSPSLSMFASESKGKKRKLDDSVRFGEIQNDDDDDDDSEIIILSVSGPGGTQTSEQHNTGVESEGLVTPKKDNMRVVEDKGSVTTKRDDGKVGALVKAALEKYMDGEEKRLALEALLREQITSLEGRLQQEAANHNISRKRIHQLEQRLMTTTSCVTQINALIQATSIEFGHETQALIEQTLINGPKGIYANLYVGQGPLYLQLESKDRIINPESEHYKLINTSYGVSIQPSGEYRRPFFDICRSFDYSLRLKGKEVWFYGYLRLKSPTYVPSEEEREKYWGRIMEVLRNTPRPDLSSIVRPPHNGRGFQVFEVTEEQLGLKWPEDIVLIPTHRTPHITKFRGMTDYDGVIAVQFEDGVLDSCGGPEVFTNIIRQDFSRLSIKLPDTLPDTVSIIRDHVESDTLLIVGVEDDKLRAKIASFTTGTLAAFKAQGCRIVHMSVCAKGVEVENTSGIPKRRKTTRPLPVANHKASGFAGSCTSASGSTLIMGTPASKGLEHSPRAHSLPTPSRSLDSDNHVLTPSFSTPASEPMGKKRKLDNSVDFGEIQNDDDDDDDEIVFLGISGPGGTHMDGEKTGLTLEARLRQQITSLEDRLQQEVADHNISREQIHLLEQTLMNITL